jgi:hypothetical protein
LSNFQFLANFSKSQNHKRTKTFTRSFKRSPYIANVWNFEKISVSKSIKFSENSASFGYDWIFVKMVHSPFVSEFQKIGKFRKIAKIPNKPKIYMKFQSVALRCKFYRTSDKNSISKSDKFYWKHSISRVYIF